MLRLQPVSELRHDKTSANGGYAVESPSAPKRKLSITETGRIKHAEDQKSTVITPIKLPAMSRPYVLDE